MNIFRHKWLLLVVLILFTSCSLQNSHGPVDLILTSCHREAIVGMLFVTVENSGSDASPSVMSVTFTTNVPKTPKVQLLVKTPKFPFNESRTLAVDLPYSSASSRFILPTGKVIMIFDATKVLVETNKTRATFISMCDDPR